MREIELRRVKHAKNIVLEGEANAAMQRLTMSPVSCHSETDPYWEPDHFEHIIEYSSSAGEEAMGGRVNFVFFLAPFVISRRRTTSPIRRTTYLALFQWTTFEIYVSEKNHCEAWFQMQAIC